LLVARISSTNLFGHLLLFLATSDEQLATKIEVILDRNKVIKAAGIVGLGTLFSRILGLVRLQVIAYVFGYSIATDAFWLGFTIPNFFRLLLAEGALSTAFIPVFSEWLAKEGEESARKLVNNVLNLIIILLLLIVSVGIFFAPKYVPYLAVGFKQVSSQMGLTVRLTQIMFPFLFFISIAALVMAFLNCKGHFAAPAFAPIFFSLALISCAFLLAPKYGIYSLGIGVVIGGALQLLVQIPSLIRKGFRYYPLLSIYHPGVRKIAKLAGPAILGGITLQINIIINRIFASTLATGSVSALLYAMRLIQFPLGIFAIALSTAIFPRQTVSLGVRVVLLVLIPSSLGLILIGKPLISLLFEHGAFVARDTLMTWQALFYYSLGLLAMGEVMVLSRAFYSLQDVFTPVKVSLAVLVLNILLNFLLISPLKHSGLALATSLSMIFNVIILFFLLRRKLKRLEGKKIFFSLAKISFITIIMGMVVYLILKGVSTLDMPSLVSGIIQVSLALGAGAVVFFFLSYLLKLEELKVLLEAFRKSPS